MVKVCGAVTEAEVTALAEAGADLVGLWHGVPGGRADLPVARLPALAAAARAAGLRPVLVTFGSDPEELLDGLAPSRVRWVQLHGFQPPSVVRRLKKAGVTVVKVLHVRAGECLERSLLRAYERAGTDCFLLDSVNAAGRIGSTAQTLGDAVATGLADQLERPFLLAGGVGATNAHAFPGVRAHPRFLGIDVDSAARGPSGLLEGRPAAAVVRGWRPVTPEGATR